MTSICDTKLLLTFKFPPSVDVREKITRLIQREFGRRLLIPSIVLTEYIKIVSKRVGVEAAITHINEFESRGALITDINRQIALEAGKLLNKYPDSPIADALLAASSIVHSAEYIVTDDRHFEKLGCKIRWI